MGLREKTLINPLTGHRPCFVHGPGVHVQCVARGHIGHMDLNPLCSVLNLPFGVRRSNIVVYMSHTFPLETTGWCIVYIKPITLTVIAVCFIFLLFVVSNGLRKQK